MATNNSNGRKIPPAAWFGIIVFAGVQLVTWGAMQQSVSSTENSLKSLKEDVAKISEMMNARIVIQEQKFESRIVRLEDWLWDMRAEIEGVRPRSFASQPPTTSDGNPL